MASSKLDYLQRYMSTATDAGDKKLRKKKKRATGAVPAQSRVQIVDGDHEWQQDAPSKDAIEQKWEMDAAEEERPVVVADGEVIDDPSDLPVYVNAEEYLDELQAKTRAAAAADADDLSPPRKRTARVAEKPRGGATSDSDNDASPPRRRRDTDSRSGRAATVAAAANTDGDDRDASLPRRQRLPARSNRRKPSDSDDDASPPRRGRAASDASPPRRGRDREPQHRVDRERAGDSDASPPRRRPTAARDDDVSPPRRSRVRDVALVAHVETVRGSEATKSPPAVTQTQTRRTDSLGRDIPESKRRSLSRSGRSGASPPRDRRQRQESRRNVSHSRSRGDRGRRSDCDARTSRPRRDPSRSRSRSASRGRRSRPRRRSPSRSRSRNRRRSTRSPSWSPRRTTGSSSRRSRGASRSVSPVRSSRVPDRSDSRHAKSSPARDTASRASAKSSPRRATEDVDPTTTSNTSKPSAQEKPPAARAGLFTASEFAAEAERKRQQNDLLRSAAAQDLGANAETVYRDKRGRKLDMLNELVRQQEIVDGKRARQAREEYEWGTGKVQKAERVSERERMEQIKSAPFARREDDPELEKLRKERVRAFDPINSRVFQNDDTTVDTKTKAKKSKRSSKKRTGAAKPKYAGPPAPPNRFGIQPGYRWDGVVRGTNWEEKLLLRENKQSAASEEAYRYAVADM